MRLSELTDALEAIAPTGRAEPWDNVGLLVGDPAQTVARVLLAIDYTPDVAREAADAGCDAVIAYHPPIFKPLSRLRADSLIFDAIRRGVAIYSPHSALDVADGGTNDVLADVVGIARAGRTPLRLPEAKASHYQLVAFVPAEAMGRVSQAIFDAGAGRIGDYTFCSFRSPGIGTFVGGQGTTPAIGQRGRPEEAHELRIETAVPIGRVVEVVRALRESHPYEEPAFNLHQLAAAPEGVGMGRVGTLEQPTPRAELLERIKRGLGIGHLLVAGPAAEGMAARAAVCAGSCGDLLDAAIAQGVDLYVTGEVRHHDALRAAGAGVTVVCTLHSNSERVTLGRLKEKLAAKLPELAFLLSRTDRDPFAIV